MPRTPEAITNDEDVIDSRDIIARLEYLREQLAAEDDNEAMLDDDEREELEMLEALNKEGEENISDWMHGETLVRDSYFREYAEQLASDIGAVNEEARWPNNHIDWSAAADELKQDYTELDFGGITYYARS